MNFEGQLNQIDSCLAQSEGDCIELIKGVSISIQTSTDPDWLTYLSRLADIVNNNRGIDAALDYYSNYHKESIRLRNEEHELLSCSSLAMVHTKQSEFEKAIALLEEGIAKAEAFKKNEKLIDLNLQLASVFRNMGNFAEAELRALDMRQNAEKTNYSSGFIRADMILGSIFGMQKRYQQSIEHFEAAGKLALANGDSGMAITCKINAANTLLHLDSFDRAEELLLDAIEYLDRKENNYMMTGAQTQLGRTLMGKEDSKNALKYLERALALAIQSGNEKQSSYIRSMIATAYLNNNQARKALAPALKSYSFHKTQGINDETPSIIKTLYTVYSQMGNAPLAYKYSIIYQELSDSLEGVANVQKLLELENEYQEKLNHEQIQTLEVESKLVKQRTTATIVIISLLALSALIVVRWQQTRIGAGKLISSHKEALFMEQAEKQRLEREKVENELHQQNQELVGLALQIAEKNELIKDIEEQLLLVGGGDPSIANQLKNTLRSAEIQGTDWSQFLQLFEVVHPEFIDAIKERNPKLTNHDIRLCSLERMNFNTKQIASILHISDEGVKKARYRLKKKLLVIGDTQVSVFLQKI